MGKSRLSTTLQTQISSLRHGGYSIKEIASELKIGIGTSNKYCKGVIISPEGKERLSNRMFRSKRMSEQQQCAAALFAHDKIGKLSKRDLFLVAIALYWGEGTKRELNLLNGDPAMIKVFLDGLLSIGIKRESVKITIRYYSHQDKEELSKFWIGKLGLSAENLVGYERVDSCGSNKLRYGMCRMRVAKASYFHKVLLQGISQISSGSSIG